jgi:hypothetical protein
MYWHIGAEEFDFKFWKASAIEKNEQLVKNYMGLSILIVSDQISMLCFAQIIQVPT